MEPSHEPDATPPDFVGYHRCLDCSKIVLDSLYWQTQGRCIDCWKDRHPLKTLEVMNHSTRLTQVRKNRWAKKVAGPDPKSRFARKAAERRLATIFPDIYAMLLDEERAIRGLAPIARYESADFEEVSSKTLAFEKVYDALDSSGATDA